LDPIAEPAVADTLLVMELAGIEEPVDPLPAPVVSTDNLSVEDALDLLAQGQVDLLTPHLDALMQKLKPLMDFSMQVRRNHSGQQADNKP
jgi:hypothetical protein